MFYRPTWNSIAQHPTPQWFRDAKFGIYTHWGVYSVPAHGPNGTWYPYHMYRRGTPQYDYHTQTYGTPDKFGYKDFIPHFTGEKFNADEWAELFKAAGARFAGPVAEHHDGFAMWDTRYTEWNAARMGPKRDVVAELDRAIRQQQMKLMLALHHAENWYFFPHWEKDYDTADPRFAGLYGEPHDLHIPPGTVNAYSDTMLFSQEKPSDAFLKVWKAKITELLDRFEPDMLWFDFGLKMVRESYKLEMLADFYNREAAWKKEVVLTYKRHDLAVGSGVLDIELGGMSSLAYHPWLTDTTVDTGEGWSYLKNTGYKSPTILIHDLIDNVSKNGCLLLNVGPKPNGEIPEEAQTCLREIGRWLALNGESVYGTTPWMVYGEGPTQKKSGDFSEDKEVRFTATDVRYAVRDNVLYATCLGWPGTQINLSAVGILYPNEITSVTMLGVERPLDYHHSAQGLQVSLPDQRQGDHAYVIKITRQAAGSDPAS